LFGQVMWYVAATAGFFALGSYLGRDLSYGWAIVSYIAAFTCLIAMNFAVRRSTALSTGLLLAVGLLLGFALAPTLSYYASTNPQVLWQAGGATALFIAGGRQQPCRPAGNLQRRHHRQPARARGRVRVRPGRTEATGCGR
jgi:FtsH-binding integral membrane protein